MKQLLYILPFILLACEDKKPVDIEMHNANERMKGIEKVEYAFLDFSKGGWAVGNGCDKQTLFINYGEKIDLQGNTLELNNAYIKVLRLYDNGQPISKKKLEKTGRLIQRCGSRLIIGYD